MQFAKFKCEIIMAVDAQLASGNYSLANTQGSGIDGKILDEEKRLLLN